MGNIFAKCNRQFNENKEKKSKREHERRTVRFEAFSVGGGECGKSTTQKQLSRTLNKKYAPNLSDSNVLEVIYTNVLRMFSEIATFILVETSIAVTSEVGEIMRTLNSIYRQYDFSAKPYWLGHCRELMLNREFVCLAKRYFASGKHCKKFDFRYWFDNAERVLEDKYVPSFKDFLMGNIKTTGSSMYSFYRQFENDLHVYFNIYTFGGQRVEKKKIVLGLENVDKGIRHEILVLFHVNPHDYDKVLYEDQEVNRMRENFEFFSQIMSHDKLKQRALVYVIFGFMDEFMVMDKVNLGKAFPEASYDMRPREALLFMKREFLRRSKFGNPINFIETSAIDSEHTVLVFDKIARHASSVYLHERHYNPKSLDVRYWSRYERPNLHMDFRRGIKEDVSFCFY